MILFKQAWEAFKIQKAIKWELIVMKIRQFHHLSLASNWNTSSRRNYIMCLQTNQNNPLILLQANSTFKYQQWLVNLFIRLSMDCYCNHCSTTSERQSRLSDHCICNRQRCLRPSKHIQNKSVREIFSWLVDYRSHITHTEYHCQYRFLDGTLTV